MQIVIRTVFFHFVCIGVFAVIYFYLKDEFAEQIEDNLEIIDYLLLSTTIQSGVGITDLYPTTFYGKVTMIIQQFLMLCTHIFTLYILTI
jgi:hypothetical protein